MRLNRTMIQWLLFIGGILVIYLREPLLFLEPRIWAEDGSRYYLYAYYFSHSPLWYKSLLGVHVGYFALWPNITSTIAANLFSVENAALVITLMAFFAQLIPLGIIILGKSEYWSTYPKKIIGIFIYLLVPISNEIWLNTATIQFFFAFAALLILIEPTDNSRQRTWAYRSIIGIAGLTGIASSPLVPIFALLTWVSKARERLIQTIMLGCCALFQASLLIYASVSATEHTTQLRMGSRDMSLLLYTLWTQSVGLLFCGIAWMRSVAAWIIARYNEGSPPLLVATWLGLLIATILLFGWLALRLSARERVVLVGSYASMLGFSFLGALTTNQLDLLVPGASPRYFWIPNLVFALLLMANVFNPASGKLRVRICAILVGIVILMGGMSYQSTLIGSQDWPRWRSEVALWRADPQHKLKIWPLGWEITLRRAE
ncbi:MAG: hypothetical protein HGB28_02470 [Oscillochloris sp.]|nr:hypothetical protein [Oscillochloris sp.]